MPINSVFSSPRLGGSAVKILPGKRETAKMQDLGYYLDLLRIFAAHSPAGVACGKLRFTIRRALQQKQHASHFVFIVRILEILAAFAHQMGGRDN